MSIAQRKELYEASAKRGGVSKMAIIGINDYDTNGDHAEAIINTNREISQGFALEITQEG